MDIQDLGKQLDYLETTKSLIKDAIVSKGQPVSTSDTFRSYATKITNISTMNAQAKTVNPSLSQQTIEPDNGYNALSSVTVNAVTSAIDNDIQANNIKSGVNILGVSGSVVELKGETKTVTPTTSQQTITPTIANGKNGLTEVTVNAVTASIDSNIKASNIKSGATILGVSGSSTVVDTSDGDATAGDIAVGKYAYVGGSKLTGALNEIYNPASIITSGGSLYYKGVFFKPDEEADPDKPGGDASGTYVITGNTGSHFGDKYLVNWVKVSNTDNWYIKGQSKVKVGMPAATVANAIGLTSNKLKQGETMLNVQGSVVELNGTTLSVTPTTSQQVLTPTSPNNGYTEVTVNAVTSSIDANIVASNIKNGVTILGVQGTYNPYQIREYASVSAMNSDIANISSGEVVKVVDSGVTTFYIKETTMKKLVKEEDTLSP